MKPAFLVIVVSVCLASAQNSVTHWMSARQTTPTNTDERIRTLERQLASSPDDGRWQGELIASYLQKVRESADPAYLDRASKLVDRMLEKDAGSFTALRFENEIDLQRHDFKAVAERAEDLLKYAPSDPGSWGNWGDALMELGEYERAGRAYLKMLSLRPNMASYNRLAYFRFVTGDSQRGIKLMQDAIAAGDPQGENVAWCWAELGDMYFKTGKLEDASRAYRASLDLFPSLHRASAGLGRVETAEGQIQAAIRDYKHAQSAIPLVEYAAALEDLYRSTGMLKEAHEQEELIETIEKLGRATGEKTNRNLALALADHNKNPDLALHLVQAEIPSRSDVYTWDALSWVLFKNGRLHEARDATFKALKLNTPEPLFYYHATVIAQASGEAKAARDYEDRLISLNPKFKILEGQTK